MQADIVVNLLTGVEDAEGNRDYTLPAIAYVHFSFLLSLQPPLLQCWRLHSSHPHVAVIAVVMTHRKSPATPCSMI